MALDDIFAVVDRVFYDNNPNFDRYHTDISDMYTSLSGTDRARANSALRFIDALRCDAKYTGVADLAALLRSVIRSSGRSFAVSPKLWGQISKRLPDPGLHSLGQDEQGLIIVDAPPWSPEWLADAQHIDGLEQRTYAEPSLGDGLLYAMSGRLQWISYQSEAQKMAVHAFLFAAAGSTTIVTMPTGAGKSLCAQLPAWVDTRGGTNRGSTTLVVVPTVALAIEQCQRARVYFAGAPNEEFRPQAWVGGMAEETRSVVRRGLALGTLPMLFLSPEALMSSELYKIALNAAYSKTLGRLVIDEAHLVETWGAGFRTDFQFLSTYRRELLTASGGALRTLLLTATLTAKGELLLENLFTEPGHITRVHAGRLRPEISYWMNQSHTAAERKTRVLEAIRYLPRPIILYSTAPEQAEEWKKVLLNEGYRRVQTFTGDTSSADREKKIRAWGEDKIDIMCATSAFGLGIDKRDVRVILHACVPENVDRFYQEVGRGGRDGCSAISLLCAEDRDFEIASGMVSKARITPEKALPRWHAMIRSGHMVDGHTMRIDLDTIPQGRSELQPSQKNRDWNEHTLLLAQRAGLIKIDSVRVDLGQPSVTAPESLPPLWMRIQLAEPDRIDDDEYIQNVFAQARDSELNDIFDSFDDMKQLAHELVAAKQHRCIAVSLARSYPDTAYACGGCPDCRARGERPYAQPLRFSAELYHGPLRSDLLSADLALHITNRRGLILEYDVPLPSEGIIESIELLLAFGIQQIIFSEWHRRNLWPAVVHSAANHTRIPHRLIDSAAVVDHGESALFAIPTAVIYPTDEKTADVVYNTIAQSILPGTPCIHIVPRGLSIPSKRGLFVERVEGLVKDLAELTRIKSSADIDFF